MLSKDVLCYARKMKWISGEGMLQRKCLKESEKGASGLWAERVKELEIQRFWNERVSASRFLMKNL